MRQILHDHNKQRIGIGLRSIIDGFIMVLTLGRCTPGLAFKYVCKNMEKKHEQLRLKKMSE